jgi:hypothetical protein
MTPRAMRQREEIVAVTRASHVSKIPNSSGVYIYKSIVNDLRHGNFIRKSEVIYLVVRFLRNEIVHP